MLLCPWDFSGKNIGVGCHSLQGIFPTQGLNLGLLHCRQILYHLSQQGSSLSCRTSLYVLDQGLIDHIHCEYFVPGLFIFLRVPFKE